MFIKLNNKTFIQIITILLQLFFNECLYIFNFFSFWGIESCHDKKKEKEFHKHKNMFRKCTVYWVINTLQSLEVFCKERKVLPN